MKLKHTIGIILSLAVILLSAAWAHLAFAQTAGVPRILSYQGRLLSSSGNLLGGAGTTYCFRFSLFNASSGGSQVWPAATALIMSATVANGVFDIGVGDTSAGGDALTYDFQDSNTVYLNVQVATLVDPTCTGGSEVFETLSPRERVVASGYAINSYSVDGYSASTNASGTMIPVIASDTLTLAGVNPEINATGTNTLTLQGGAGTGAIQFFSANNYITSSTFRVAGMVSANMLQMAVAPTQSANASLISLGQLPIKNGVASGTFIGINTSGTYNGDYLEFENNSSTVLEVASSGQLTIATTTNISNSLFYIATSSNIFTVMSNGDIGIGTSSPSTQLQVVGPEALGVSSSTEGQLLFYNSLTSSTVTLQGSTSTPRSFTLTLPNSTGTAGQSLVTDGNGNLSWGSTGFTVIASTSVNKVLTVAMASDTTAGITPSSLNSEVWITANVMASTTAATSSVGIGVYKTATCTSLVGSVVTSTFDRASTTIPGIFNMTLNVVDAPASTTKQNYWLCADYAGTVSNLSYAELTLQEIRAGSDVAEVYYAATGTQLTAGDVISLDPSISDGVKQSESPYDNTLMGIISTQPGATLGNSDPPSGVQELVALAGRVPINVTNENGDINAGDYLTSSDIPGIAMRATGPGRVVAIAMQSFTPDPSEGTTTGSILAFVDVGWEPGDLIGTTSTASSSFSIGDDLRNFFGIFANIGDAVQTFIRASMIAVENLFVKTEVILPGGNIKVPSGPDQISGIATLGALSSAVFISNTQVTSSSKIFITPTALTAVPLVVISEQDGVGFSVGVAVPQANDVPFDWVMVQSYHVGGADVSWNQNTPPADTSGGGGGDATDGNMQAATTTDTGAATTTVVTSDDDSSSTDATSGTTDDIDSSVSAPTSTDTTIAVPDTDSSSSDTTADVITDATGTDSTGTTQ